MVTRTVIIKNKTGLHARPATAIVTAAKDFQSNITIENGNVKANAKSILNLLALGAKQGVSLVVKAEGTDEEEALNAVAALLEQEEG